MPFWSHDYVCCAIPLYNVGIYCILFETGAVALTTGVLAFAAPTVVAVSIPSFGPYILGGLCMIIVALQFWGFYGVFKEKANIYRTFVRTNVAFIAATLLLALIWVILSMVNHDKGKAACVAQFVAVGSDTSAQSGETICNIFTWVQVGLLIFLWLFVAIAQAYFLNMERIYGFEQRRDHAKYNSVYSTLGEEIALRKSGVYSDRDRPSFDRVRPMGGHDRTDSNMSKASALRNEMQLDDLAEDRGTLASRRTSLRYNDPYAPTSLSPNAARSLSRPRSGDMRAHHGSGSSAVSVSRSAHNYPPVRSPGAATTPTRLPSPAYPPPSSATPVVAAFAGPRQPSPLTSPDATRSHPLEGMNGRKAPRLDNASRGVGHGQGLYDAPRY